jgi:hypothetical protein
MLRPEARLPDTGTSASEDLVDCRTCLEPWMNWTLGLCLAIPIALVHMLHGKAWRRTDDLDSVKALYPWQTGGRNMIPHYCILASMMHGND